MRQIHLLISAFFLGCFVLPFCLWAADQAVVILAPAMFGFFTVPAIAVLTFLGAQRGLGRVARFSQYAGVTLAGTLFPSGLLLLALAMRG